MEKSYLFKTLLICFWHFLLFTVSKIENRLHNDDVIILMTHRCEAGSDTWVQCNDAPVKVCKYPVHGLKVGCSYHFRVRAVNSAGISRPSRKSDKVTAIDPAESERLQGTEEGKCETGGTHLFPNWSVVSCNSD